MFKRSSRYLEVELKASITSAYLTLTLTVKMTLKGKSFRKWASGLNFYEIENEINLRGYSDPVLGLYTCL